MYSQHPWFIPKVLNDTALHLQVLGNAKGVVATVVSILLFRNPVSTAGMIGYSLTVLGVILYSESKKHNQKALTKQKMLDAEQNVGAPTK